MTPILTESNWKKNMTFIRDVVFIILFLASIVGWIRSETISKTKLEMKVETLSETVNGLTKEIEKTNEILSQQQVLNGKIIQYMQMK